MPPQQNRRELERLCERNLHRALTAGESSRLWSRVERLGEEQVRDVVLGYSALALEAWLEDPDAY